MSLIFWYLISVPPFWCKPRPCAGPYKFPHLSFRSCDNKCGIAAIQIQVGAPQDEKADIIQEARRIWCTWKSSARSFTKPRADKGLKRKRPCDDPAPAATVGPLPVVPALLDESHKKEFKFQEGRQIERKIEAFRSGLLLDHEVSEDLRNAEADYKKREKKNLADALRKAKLRRVVVSSTVNKPQLAASILRGARVYVAANVRMRTACQAWMREYQMSRAAERKLASIFISQDAANPGRRVLWAAGLTGGVITTAALNIFVVYHKALSKKSQTRFFWVSDAFAAASPGTASIIQHLVRASAGWKLISKCQFAARVAAAMATKSRDRGNLFGLIRSGEAHGLSASCKPRLFHEAKLMKRLVRVNRELSILGSG